jgi:voltage-gated potassium channel
MVMTTMGSEYFPHSPEGRVLCLLLAVFAFAVFGYVTAALATFFVGRDADTPDGEVAGEKSVEALRREIESLRREVNGLRTDLSRPTHVPAAPKR